jgi:hypothetical protein
MQYSLEERLNALRNGITLPNLPSDGRTLEEIRGGIMLDNLTQPPSSRIHYPAPSINPAPHSNSYFCQKIFDDANSICGSYDDRLSYLESLDVKTKEDIRGNGTAILTAIKARDEQLQEQNIQSMMRISF